MRLHEFAFQKLASFDKCPFTIFISFQSSRKLDFEIAQLFAKNQRGVVLVPGLFILLKDPFHIFFQLDARRRLARVLQKVVVLDKTFVIVANFDHQRFAVSAADAYSVHVVQFRSEQIVYTRRIWLLLVLSVDRTFLIRQHQLQRFVRRRRS